MIEQPIFLIDTSQVTIISGFHVISKEMKTEQYNEHAGIKNSKNTKVQPQSNYNGVLLFLISYFILNAKNIDI